MDLTKLSDADLLALQSGDLSKMSDVGLASLSGQEPVATPTRKEPSLLEQARTAADPYIPQVAVDVAGGATGLLRGGANIVGGVFGNSKLGQQLWPTTRVNKDSLGYLAGEIADPVSMLVGGKAFQLAGKIPQIVKATNVVRPIAQGMVGGAGAGAITGALSEGGDAGTGAVLGGVVGGAIPGVALGVRKLAQVAEPITKAGARTAAGRMVKDVVGNTYDDVLGALRNLNTPFSKPSVAQATSKLQNPELAALQRLSERVNPLPAVGREASQRAEREGLISSFAGTDDEIKRMVESRAATSTANSARVGEGATNLRIGREAAVMPPQPVVTTVPSQVQPGMVQKVVSAGETPNFPSAPALESLKQNPGFRAAIADARRRAANAKGIVDSGFTPDEIADILKDPTKSFKGLQLMKAAIDDRFANPTDTSTALSKIDDRSLTKLKNAFVGASEQAAPGWGAAREKFAEQSSEIFQKKVGQNMLGLLQKPLGEAESGAKLARAVEAETALVKKSGGFGRSGLDEQLTPENAAKVGKVISQLDVDTTLTELARKGAGSSRLQNVVGEAIHLPNLMNQGVALTNGVIRRVFGAGQIRTLRELSEIMQDPAMTAKLMEQATAKEKNAIEFIRKTMRYYAPYAAAKAGEME